MTDNTRTGMKRIVTSHPWYSELTILSITLLQLSYVRILMRYTMVSKMLLKTRMVVHLSLGSSPTAFKMDDVPLRQTFPSGQLTPVSRGLQMKLSSSLIL